MLYKCQLPQKQEQWKNTVPAEKNSNLDISTKQV